MRRFLLDTNICIFFNKGVRGLREKLAVIGISNCAISEITYTELLFGVEKSDHRYKNLLTLEQFMTDIEMLSIGPAIPVFAKEKARLQLAGASIDNFDLLIGATAIHHNMTLVTNNTRHFERLQGIRLEDWTK